MKTHRGTNTKALRSFLAVVGCSLMAAFAAPLSAQTTTITGTAGGNDSWNTGANWSGGVPTGVIDAIIDNNINAQVNNAATPAYTGTLTLNDGAILQLRGSNSGNTFGTAITMNQGSQILIRTNQALVFPTITLLGDGTINLSPSTEAHNVTRNFGNAINGPGGLTIVGNNNITTNLNVANSFSSLTLNSIDRWRLLANVAGALGTGDVTLNPRADGRSGVIFLNAVGAIDSSATLSLSGRG